MMALSAVVTLAMLLVGCGPDPNSDAIGFRLPKGDIEKGKTAFMDLKCHTCHSIKGVELPETASTSPYHIVLGGEVQRVKSYGQLLTAIVYPSHGLAPQFDRKKLREDEASPMPQYNDVMTTEQLINLVAFLQSRYQLRLPDYPSHL